MTIKKPNRFNILVLVSFFISTILSFYIRVNFWPFTTNLGLYQGDIWYFFTYYGKQISTQFFFPVEYPVGFILIQKINLILSQIIFNKFTYETFVLSHTLVMTPIILASVFLSLSLSKTIKKSKILTYLYLLLSPTFFIAISTNYDIFPIFFILLAIFLTDKKRYNLSFLSLGLGAVIKIFPAFLIPLFILYIYSREKDFKKLVKPLIIFVLTVVLINLPFALYNFKDFLFPFIWQTTNPQRLDPNTISYSLASLGLGQYQKYVLVVVITNSIFISYKFFKQKKLNWENFLLLSFFTCFSAVFGNHVNTPQYLLWFLPFVAIFQFPKLLLWWIFDLINSLILYGYFKLHYDFSQITHYIFTFLVLYQSVFYIAFILKLSKILNEKNKP